MDADDHLISILRLQEWNRVRRGMRTNPVGGLSAAAEEAKFTGVETRGGRQVVGVVCLYGVVIHTRCAGVDPLKLHSMQAMLRYIIAIRHVQEMEPACLVSGA